MCIFHILYKHKFNIYILPITHAKMFKCIISETLEAPFLEQKKSQLKYLVFIFPVVILQNKTIANQYHQLHTGTVKKVIEVM